MAHQHAGPQRERLNKQGTRRLSDPLTFPSSCLYGDGLMHGGDDVARFYSVCMQAGLGRLLVKVLGSGCVFSPELAPVGSQTGTIGSSSHREPSTIPLVPSHMLLLSCIRV